MAEQVARLKLQNLTQVDISAYAHLLEDPPKKALAMVAEQALAIITGGPGTGKPIPWRVLLQCSNKVCLIFVLRWLHRQVRRRSG